MLPPNRRVVQSGGLSRSACFGKSPLAAQRRIRYTAGNRMNWEAVGAIGETIGALGVVVSLVYLAIQLRTNSQTLKANAAWDAEVLWGEANVSIGEKSEVALLVHRAAAADAKAEDFSEEERAAIYFLIRGALQYAQAQWWLWKEGNLPDEIWTMRRRWARNYINAPLMNAVWNDEIKQYILTEDFVRDVMSIEPDGEIYYSPSEPDAA